MRGAVYAIAAVVLGGSLIVAAGAELASAQAAPPRAAPPITVHVATDGNDVNDGLAATAGGSGKGPVRTVARAQALVQRLRVDAADRSIDVALAGGIYILAQPLRLDAKDSGSLTTPVTYRPELGASVTLSGGSPMGPWRVEKGGEWVAAIDPHINGGACPSQLFVGDQRRERSRWPASGELKIEAVPGGSTASFITKAADLPAGFRADASTEIVIIDAWVASRLWVASYDPATRQIELRGDFLAHGTQKGLRAGLPYYIENAPTDRLLPGNWQCDAKSRSLRYRPIAGEKPETVKAVVPRLTQLLVMQGGADAPVHDIAIRSLNFAHAAWPLPTKGWAVMQAEVGLPAAIKLADCRHITLSGITVEHVGANALDISSNCSDVELAGSHLADIGGGGVAIGSFQRKPMPNSNWTGGDSARGETTDIRILGNDIRAIGRIQRAAVGVLSGQASHVRVANNHISDLYYSGVSLGWVWNDGPSLSHDNAVTNNVIDHYGQGVMSDMGGIYTLGRQDGTVISGNRISNGKARDYGGWGLYADQGSSGIRFDHNSVSSTSHAGIFVHMPGTLSFTQDSVANSGEAGVRCAPGRESAVKFDGVTLRVADNVEPTQGCEGRAFSFTSLQVTKGRTYKVLNSGPVALAF